MKQLKLSLAILAMAIGSITSFAFRTKTVDSPCKTGNPAQFKSQCSNLNSPLCCETAGGHMYLGPKL
jgi:hypothetical protein